MCITVLHIKILIFTVAFSLFLAITCDFAKIKYENKENHIADELKILQHYNHISP